MATPCFARSIHYNDFLRCTVHWEANHSAAYGYMSANNEWEIASLVLIVSCPDPTLSRGKGSGNHWVLSWLSAESAFWTSQCNSARSYMLANEIVLYVTIQKSRQVCWLSRTKDMLQTLLVGSGDVTMFPGLLTIDCLHYAKNKEHVLHNTVFFLNDDGQVSSTWIDTTSRSLFQLEAPLFFCLGRRNEYFQVFPFHFAYCKWSKTGEGKAWELG